MSGESDVVDRLAQSIADGTSIDWSEIDKLPADDRLKRLFALLRMVDEVAEVHRSLGSEPVPEQSQADAHATPPAHELAAPAEGIGRWGHLLLRRKIGEGTFGEVFHAHDTWLDHPVALKLFKPKITGRSSATRILHEARKLARIRHQNIVTVHGADSHEGRVGFWMDLIEGTTLETIVRGGRLSAKEASNIGQEVCSALAAVHHTGIIHRDIKAQNVMRASDGGRIILMDFGAGEFIADQAQGTRKQGTPLYLAPEIFGGADATFKSDIYAVGVLLYYLVTGDYPVRADSVPQLIDAHRRGNRRRLRDARPDLPSSFVSIVECALDPDPDQRFSSAGEMENALTRRHPSGPIPSPWPPMATAPIERDESRARGHLLALAAVPAGVLIAVLGILGFIACRVFDVALAVEPDFAAGLGDYFKVGVQSLLPFAIFWVAGGMALVVMASLRPMTPGRLAAVQNRARRLGQSLDGETLATIVFFFGLIGWLLICRRSAEVFAALDGLRQASAATNLWALTSAARSIHLEQAAYSTWLGFLLGLAAWRWFPLLEKRAGDPSRVRLLRWASVVLIFLIVVSVTVPRRLVWERFEVVSFENEPAAVIGDDGDELLLYRPYRQTLKYRRVRTDAPSLEREVARQFIFDVR